MNGFFHTSSIRSAPPSATRPQCGACGLLKGCRHPKLAPFGQGAKRVLFVAAAPTPADDAQGRPQWGPGWGLLTQAAQAAGLSLAGDCWLTHAIICTPGDRAPTDAEVGFCRPSIVETIARLNPAVIVPLGKAAIQSVIGHYYKESPGPERIWVGDSIPLQSENRWICPTWHPDTVLGLGEKNAVYKLQFFQHIKAVAGRAWSPPWAKPPNWVDRVRVEQDAEVAARVLMGMAGHTGAVSFDFESNCLKPDDKRAAIVSCAVSDGRTTIAYPWVGGAIKATRHLLHGRRCIAHNMKHEDRWCKNHLPGTLPRWVWCTMNNAHIADNREGVSGLKHQAFATLGFPPYTDRIAGLFETSRILSVADMLRSIRLSDLLLYNGLDALLTFELAHCQARRAGLTHILTGEKP